MSERDNDQLGLTVRERQVYDVLPEGWFTARQALEVSGFTHKWRQRSLWQVLHSLTELEYLERNTAPKGHTARWRKRDA